uniref:Uncharacterized protein n=1 Tax=Strongyloides papillosus TaxID=174720 RepID=A0A0N5C6J5_STREA
MRVFETVFLSLLASNIVKIYGLTIWITGQTRPYNPMNLPVDIKLIDFEIKVVVVEVTDNNRTVAKEDGFSMRAPFHVNIHDVPPDFQKTKVYNVFFLYHTPTECKATAKKTIPKDCILEPVRPKNIVYKCILKNIDPNTIKQRWEKMFEELWKRNIFKLDPWSEGSHFDDDVLPF